jgi:hypothetical protein
MFTPYVNRWASRFGFAFALVAFLGLGLTLMPAPAKAAGLALEQCTGLHSATWSPGVTNIPGPHTVTTTSNWQCTGLGGLLTPASSINQFQATFACSGLLAPVNNLVWTINWHDSSIVLPPRSTFSFNVTVQAVNGNLVITSNNGRITDGRFAGNPAVATFTLLGLAGLLNNQCNTPTGLTGAGGPTTLTIL